MNTLWIGAGLGPIERACLRSAMQQGHPVRLFCYEPISGVPDGVEVADAAAILPPGKIFRYEDGSVALFANLFRYALQRQGLGMWVDTDPYFLRPHGFAQPYVFGWQVNAHIANGVLKIPADSPILPLLLEPFEGRSIPPWANERERERAQMLREEHGRIPMEKMGWGFTGPRALTYVATAHGLHRGAQAPDVFYPANFTVAEWILDPSRALAEMITPDSVGIHLWNQKIKHFKNEPAAAGSFLARLQEEGA